MFGWFSTKRKKPARKYKDLVWISSEAKWEALPQILNENQPFYVYGWFSTTVEKAQKIIKAAGFNIPVKYASDFNEIAVTNATVILIEHYPLPQREEQILSNGNSRETLVLSALDEPLFTYFGGDRIISLMQKMGMHPSEIVEHKMISSSILRAQEKISKKVTSDFPAKSQEEWFRYSGWQQENTSGL